MNFTILIPCYNGGKLLKKNLPSLFSYINNHNDATYKVVVVNDGSKDDTLNILQEFNDITLLTYDNNKGKGGAIQYGINHIDSTEAILIMDCDFATSLNSIETVIKEIECNDIVIANRFIKGSVLPIKRTFRRRIISKCCNIVVNFLFHFRITDTQCGFKCLKYDLAKQIAAKQIIMGWAFDVEYLYIAKLNKKKIKQIPVMWTESDTSEIRIAKASVGFIKSLFKIKKNKRNYYL